MKKIHFLISFLLLFCSSRATAQEKSLLKRNQIYVEAFGNNFVDWNSYNWSYVSINYGRMLGQGSNFIVSVGLSAFKSKYIVTTTNPATYPTTTVATTPVGFLWRNHYKRNGFWIGLFFTPAFGKQWYYVETYRTTINYVDQFSFQFSPNLSYQFQSKSGNFFCRLSFTPKIYASVFAEKFGNDHKVLPFWGGISIGGAW